MQTTTPLSSRRLPQRLFDATTALLAGLALLPLWCVLTLRALAAGQNPLGTQLAFDTLGRPVRLHRFAVGPWADSARLLDVLHGEVSLCGAGLGEAEAASITADADRLPPGLVSLAALRRRIGLSVEDPGASLAEHARRDSLAFHVSLVLRGAFSAWLYRSRASDAPRRFEVFGVRIDNVSMQDALAWIRDCLVRPRDGARLAYFVNVNSLNQTCENARLREVLAGGDRVFADGSGVRLAGLRQGVRVRGNVNGTDLLPALSRLLVGTGRSAYLLGGRPGVAEAAARRLAKRFPGLSIVGCRDGYFAPADNADVVAEVNASGADVLLVGLGTPLQEYWLDAHRTTLHAQVAFGVGGLFDFYSGRIPRAPMWLREIGLEWVWRLTQEPAAKWRRYLLGNPLFLARLYFA